MKKLIPVLVLLAFIGVYFFESSNKLENIKPQQIEKSNLLKIDSVVVNNMKDEEEHTDDLEYDSDTESDQKTTLKDVEIDSIVFLTQIVPPIKEYHKKLFDAEHSEKPKPFKPGDRIEIFRDGDYVYVKAEEKYRNRIVEKFGHSAYTIDFNILETADRKDTFYEGVGHSVIIPRVAYVNTYNNASLIKDDFDCDGHDDLLVTTYWYLGGAHGSQTKFLFLNKGGKYKLAYSDKMVYKSNCFFGASTQDGYDYSEDGILHGSCVEYGEGSAGCCPSHFYDTKTIFLDGKLQVVTRTLTRHLVMGKDGRLDYEDVES